MHQNSALTPMNTKKEDQLDDKAIEKIEIDDSQMNMVLQLESYEEMKSPLPVFINVDQVEKELLSPDTAGQREKSAGH